MRATALRRPWGDANESAGGPDAVRIAPRPPLVPRRVGRLRRQLAHAAPVAGVLLVAGGLAFGLLAPTRAPGTARVLVLVRSLTPGSVVTADDLAAVSATLAPAQLDALVPAAEERSVLGRTLSASLDAGAPLVRSALAAGGEPAALTLSVGVEHALGGALLPGDRVSVLATFSTPSGGAVTRVLARGLVVLAVGRPPGLADPSQATVAVTLALADAALAPRLALANSVAHLDLLRDGTATPRPLAPARVAAVAA